MSGISPGQVVDGRYRIVSRVGTGGMADVFLAEDEQLGRRVALKLLHRRFAEDPGFVERFRREAHAAASLQHPNVVSVFDRGSWDGTYYIAMEYLEGRTLKQLIRDEAPLDALEVIDLTVQILKAARFAHRRGVIHRDLKPHNVIVDEQSHVKVTDFGIARAGASDMTETGSIMGTAQYLSPEQAQGQAVGETSDLYSVAVVMYEMLTGRVPFDAESAVTIALKHVSEAPPPPSQFNHAIPPILEQTVLWALNKNPADRPVDADQFIGVLEGVRAQIAGGQGGQPTASMRALGVPEGVLEAAAGAERPRPRVQLGSRPVPPTTVMPALAGGEVISDAAVETRRPPEERPHSRDGRWWPWAVLLLVVLLIGGGIAAYALTRPPKVTVPDVVPLQLSQAEAVLNQRGLTPSPINQVSNQAAGTVFSQDPLAGSRVRSGSTVTLFVSSGPGQTSVPSVVQLSRKQAEAAIRRAGLKVGRILPESSSMVPSGDATRTDPPTGTQLESGSAVTLFVSDGPAPSNVPNVVGEQVSAATAALSAFTVKVTQQDSSQPAGQVLSQSPSAGSQAKPGSTVTLVVSNGTPTTTNANVPSVIQGTQSAAEATLRGSGFKVRVKYRVVRNPANVGLVVAQSPNGGTAPQGSTVTITVGKSAGGGTVTQTTPTVTGTTGTGTSGPGTSTTGAG